MTAQPQRASNDIGPAHQLLDIEKHARRIPVPARLIGSPGQALHVWIAIKYAVDLGHGVPSNLAIAKRCGISPTHVGRAVVWLRKEGWLA